jgi:cytochrome oxidase Cu insertion factor (SCO1/SenC/PrrC family)
MLGLLKSRVFWLVATVLIVAAALSLSFLAMYQRGQPQDRAALGTVQVGGPFTLTDHNGNTVTDADYRGHLLLVYFGYTYCPDICPTELLTMSEALLLVGEEASKIQPLFITVDPERDTVEVLRSYVAAFHPQLVGLTGTPEQIADVARAYRVYYAKAEGGGANDYLMDHSSFVYLMDENGTYLTHFSLGTKAEEMADVLRQYLAAKD